MLNRVLRNFSGSFLVCFLTCVALSSWAPTPTFAYPSRGARPAAAPATAVAAAEDRELAEAITSLDTALAGEVSDELSTSAAAPGDAPAGASVVTREQFQRSIRVLKRTLERVQALERKQGEGGGSADGAVDLNALSAEPGKAPVATGSSKSGHQSLGISPNFKVFFDLNLVRRPGKTGGGEFSFENYHAFLFYEIVPNEKFMFAFDVSPSPKFFELDYMITPKLQLRAGKIWIPFDDMAPHNIFGGRVNVSRISPGGRTFLPETWADLGVGMKYQIIDTTALNLVSHLYIVNGFSGGGTDPAPTPAAYPNFSSAGGGNDNNTSKALGGRIHAMFAGKVGVGASLYTGRWNDNADLESYGVTLYALDAQLRLAPFEFRVGLASGTVGIPTDALLNESFKRGGFYGEVGYRFGKERTWKLLARGGSVQLDDRAISPTDQSIYGLTLLRQFGPLEVSLEHSIDTKDVPGKTEKQYTNLRLVVAL